MARRISNRLRRLVRRLRYRLKLLLRRTVHVHIENRWRLGDEVLAIPFYELVANACPDATLTVSVNRPDLLRDNPFVSVDNRRGEFDCDRYIFARDDARATPRLEHLCALHRIPYRPREPQVIPPDGADLPRPMPDSEVVVACSCGAGWPCKSWATSHMTALCETIRHECPSVGFVEVGRDCPVAGVGTSYVDGLSVGQTAYVLSRSRLYVGPDSGLAHLAMAVGTPSAVLYGPVKPDRAFGARERLCAVVSPAACQGCWTEGRMREPGQCPLGIRDSDPEAYPCMRQLTAELVSDTMRRHEVLSSLRRET